MIKLENDELIEYIDWENYSHTYVPGASGFSVHLPRKKERLSNVLSRGDSTINFKSMSLDELREVAYGIIGKEMGVQYAKDFEWGLEIE